MPSLSVLIPAYNQSCLELVKALQHQCEAEGLDYEIIVADDGSIDEKAKTENQQVGMLPGCQVLMFPQNKGRSATRNKLILESRGDYLLFIDSDAQVISQDFIHQYSALWPTNAVVCGGIIHPDSLPSQEVSLRYWYEKACEPRFTAQERNLHPYKCLRSFNFMLPREVAQSVPFDEKVRTYGYEDTLLGKAYKEKGIEVRHIDNPLLNSELEDNATFLEKTCESMRTLYQIENEIEGYSSLLSTYHRLQRWHLVRLIAWVYSLMHKKAERSLLKDKPNITLLQAYKLGYFCKLHYEKEVK